MKVGAAIEHAKGAPNTDLSVNLKDDGTEALIKISTEDGTYSPGWENSLRLIMLTL